MDCDGRVDEFCGGIEKEATGTGNERRIEAELAPAVRRMLAARGCFPMFDHALSTPADFAGLCRSYTRLRELCGSAPPRLGEFPRM